MAFLAFAMIVSAFLFYAAGRSAPSFSRSIPAFLVGLLPGALIAAIAYFFARRYTPPSALLKAAETMLLYGLLPLFLLYVINLLFFRREVEYSAPQSFAGWLVPQYFGCLAVCIPLGILERFRPADPLICFFFALTAILAAFVLRAFLFQFWGYGGAGRLAVILIFPLAAVSLFSVALAFRFFCMPEVFFVIVSASFDFALLVLSLAVGRNESRGI